MKSFDEFVAWMKENNLICEDMGKMYSIYMEGYLNGYEQCELDEKEQEHWFGANSNWS